jgi:hypothetical protein
LERSNVGTLIDYRLLLHYKTYAVTGWQGGLAGCKPAKNPFARSSSGGAAAAAAASRSFRGGFASPKPATPQVLLH